MRKTVKIDILTEQVNVMLVNLADEDVRAREAIAQVLEQTLHKSNAYAGFRYLDADDMKESCSGTTVGINETGQITKGYNDRFVGTDRTRVKYF